MVKMTALGGCTKIMKRTILGGSRGLGCRFYALSLKALGVKV